MALSQSVEAQSTSQTSDTWSLGGRLLTRLHNGLERLGLYGHNSTSSSRPLLCPNLTLYFTPEVGGNLEQARHQTRMAMQYRINAQPNALTASWKFFY